MGRRIEVLRTHFSLNGRKKDSNADKEALFDIFVASLPSFGFKC